MRLSIPLSPVKPVTNASPSAPLVSTASPSPLRKSFFGSFAASSPLIQASSPSFHSKMASQNGSMNEHGASFVPGKLLQADSSYINEGNDDTEFQAIQDITSLTLDKEINEKQEHVDGASVFWNKETNQSQQQHPGQGDEESRFSVPTNNHQPSSSVERDTHIDSASIFWNASTLKEESKQIPESNPEPVESSQTMYEDLENHSEYIQTISHELDEDKENIGSPKLLPTKRKESYIHIHKDSSVFWMSPLQQSPIQMTTKQNETPIKFEPQTVLVDEAKMKVNDCTVKKPLSPMFSAMGLKSVFRLQSRLGREKEEKKEEEEETIKSPSKPSRKIRLRPKKAVFIHSDSE